MDNNNTKRMSEASEAFIAAAKAEATFDIDIDFCIRNKFVLSNHSPSTSGVNLFVPETGIEVFQRRHK